MPDEKRPYVRETEVNRQLESYRQDIVNGMGDQEIHRLTQIPIRTIQRWRLKNGLKHGKGFEAKQASEFYAISTLGEALGDARHRTSRSTVGGVWEPPVFVVREHIDYDRFLRVLDAAHRVLGMSEEELVKGLGMSPNSISQGLAIYARHLNSGNKKCLHCEALMDPNTQSLFCTTICERLHV